MQGFLSPLKLQTGHSDHSNESLTKKINIVSVCLRKVLDNRLGQERYTTLMGRYVVSITSP